MTTEQKAKAYDEALEKARKRIATEPQDHTDAILKDIFPQLCESEDEDERIRKFLLRLAKRCSENSIDFLGDIKKKDVIDWLEKQKENIGKEYVFRPLAGTDITIAAEQAIRRANEGDCLVLAFNGAFIPVRKGCNVSKIVDIYDSFIEKQKEQKHEEDDFTIYHPIKNGNGKYECIPYSFYGSLTSFSNNRDLMDFINESFYDKEECERWCEIENEPELPECKHKIKKESELDCLCESSDREKQKEQKPADIIDPFSNANFVRGYKSGYADAKREQKPAEWSLEDDHIIGFVYDLLNEIEWKDNWAMSKDECLRLLNNYRPQKPAEWSEEDEDNLCRVIRVLEDNDSDWKELTNWLKSLRPHWKPSEEQMEALSETIAFAPDTFKPKCTLVTLQDDLKKLMEE